MFNSIRRNKNKTLFIATLVAVFVALVFYFIMYFISPELGYFAIPIAVGASFIGSFFSYFFSDKIILAVTRAKPADEYADKKVKNAMEGLIIASGMPMPRVYIMEEAGLNAFATGRNPKNAVICVTRGLVEKLDYYQLEAVLAHELAHIKNYDILLQTVATIMIGAVVMISNMFTRMVFYGGGRRSSNKSGGQAQIILFVIGLVFLILAPLFGQLLKMALSRNREYLADSTGVEFTRNPEALATALEAISQDSIVEHADPATASLFIASAHASAKGHKKGGWFSTHPPIEQRVAAIRNISA